MRNFGRRHEFPANDFLAGSHDIQGAGSRPLQGHDHHWSFRMSPERRSAREWFEETRPPRGERYGPLYGGIKISCVPHPNLLPFWRSDYKEHFSVRTGTIVDRSEMIPQKRVIPIRLMSKNLKVCRT